MEINSDSKLKNRRSESAEQHSRPKPRSMPIFESSEDVVISGIAGRFPESENMDEFAEKLYNNIDMVTCDDRRWPADLYDGLISRSGKLKELDRFDASFFRTLPSMADAMDAHSRIMLETTYEAICDAGVNPQTMRGTKTGVYVGNYAVASSDDAPQNDFQDSIKKDALNYIYGTLKAIYANRISFLMDFTGPSNYIDTACSSSLVAFVYALNDIRHGVCDQAVVATANLIQAPITSLAFHAMRMQSRDGKCKAFDKSADGFVRSETVGTIFLQKKSDAKRVYATVLHAKTNCDGFKSRGLFTPNWLTQSDLMIETFQEAGINPSEVKFFEFHGTGTAVGDPQEAKAVADAYCSERYIAEPLMIGSVKSNMGHSEGSSGFCSLAKAIIVFENQCIPANLHFEEPNPKIESIVNKTLLPVVKNTAFVHNIIGLNSFGIGGVNAHALLKANDKQLNEDINKIAHIIPRLVNVCGRTNESVKYIFDFIESNPNKANREFLALLTDVMKTHAISGSSNFPYRGYMVIKEKCNNEHNSIQYDYTRTITTANNKQSVWLAFTGMGSQWTAMAKTLMPIKTFADSIKRSANVLKPYNIDLMHILLSDDHSVLNEKITNPFVAITSMQIALYDVICLLNLKIEGIIGHSFGEIACAYVDGCLTQEQAVLCSYWRGKVVENAKQNNKLPKGMLAAVGLSWQEVINRCPDGIVAACHNGSDSVTISGLYDNMVVFIEQLSSENIFARQVSGGDFPYHSNHMKIVAQQLLDALKSVIRHPKQRSNKWISTSVPTDQWNHEKAKTASGEYFTNNLISAVYFNEGMSKIPSDSIVIEVAPHSLFESIFKRCYSNLIYTSLMKRTESDNLDYILSSIGTLYTYGLNPDIENLYPRIEWPVSRGTQSISSLIKWDHQRSNEVKKYPEYYNYSTASDYTMKVSLLDPDWSFLKDHAINGKVLFPATGYLTMAWRRLAALRCQPWNKTSVAFENVRFLRSTLITENIAIKFKICILERTGDFTITEASNVVCTGKVYIPDNPVLESPNQTHEVINHINDDEHTHELLSTKDIYKELKVRGYDYGPQFQGLIESRGNGQRGLAQWTGHVISFMDSLLHLAIIAQPIRALFVPIGFRSIRIDPNILFQAIRPVKTAEIFAENPIKKKFYYFNGEVKEPIIESMITQNEKITVKLDNEEENRLAILPVSYDANVASIMTTGIHITGLIAANLPRKAAQTGLLLEKCVFIANNEELPIDDVSNDNTIEYIEVCCSLIVELSNNSLILDKSVTSGYKCADELTVNRYLESLKDNHKVLNFLIKLIACGHVINETKDSNVEDIAVENELNVDFDRLKTVFTNERFIRPLLDIVIENSFDRRNLRVLELNPTNTIMGANISKIIRKSIVGYINVDYCVSTPSASDVPEDIKSNGLQIIEWDISEQRMLKDISSLDLLIYRPNTQILSYFSIEDQIKAIKDAVKDNGFILIMTRETLTPPELAINELFKYNTNKEIFLNKELDNFLKVAVKYNLGVIAKKSDSMTSTMVLLRKLKPETTPPEVINITNGKFEQWVDVLKEIFESNRNANTKKNLWLVANDTPINGIIGLVNCLRLETGGEFIRCIFDCDNNLPLPVDFSKSPYNQLIKMDLTMNVYKCGEWGTFRHLSVSDKQEIVMTEHAYLNIVTRGDISSLKWFEARHKHYHSLKPENKSQHQIQCNVYYSALNFRDVVLATCRIQTSPEMSVSDCILGIEFAGRRSDNGKRVMGMCPSNGIATTVLIDQVFLSDVPDEWTLEEAATVPIVYLTVYYALIMKADIQCGQSVLIHSGAGGVGQAAINICQSLNCEIFVTVGNQQKRKFIKNTFNIDDTHIGNSRDTSFESQVMTVTKGKGVDIVLNSLTEDKLQASVRCLAFNGKFLEIGKYDMQINSNLGLFTFLKYISFHSVSLDIIFNNELDSIKRIDLLRQLTKLMNEGIANNVVKPIVRTVFDMNECEQAFRYMTTGRHIGKVLIKIRDEESERIFVNPSQLLVNATPKTWFNPTKVYIIIGGLGGMGLELAYWMALRGAKRLVLTSRTGIKNDYQKFILKRIKQIDKLVSDSDNCEIEMKVVTNHAITLEDSNKLVDETMRMGSIGGIFNLSLVLRDNFIENQTVEAFKSVCDPKLDLLSNLDVITQAKCPQLDYFVCFSSLVAGRGNAGQTNYGYANSAMERICESRRTRGLHGLAIQWGPICDVGVVAEQLIDTVYRGDVLKLFTGILLQRIHSCLEVLDRYLQSPFPVLSSIEKVAIDRIESKTVNKPFQQFFVYLNIDNRSDSETLGYIGLESMMIVEIQQRLQKDFRISLTLAQIRNLTVAEFKKFGHSN